MADTWTTISGYTPQDYSDTLVFEMSSETKQVEKILGQALVAGEENSQYIKFVLPRYWDGIDISSKTFTIEYALAGAYYGTSEAVNAEMSDEQVRFGWVVPETACAISGTLFFILKVESNDYILKSQIVEVSVYKTINVEGVVPEPTKEAWYREFAARVETAISEAESALSAAQEAQASAETAAQNAQTAEDNAEAAAAISQIRYGSPLTAAEADDMVEQNRVYVYVGNETGYTNGHWYYYNGTEWADGGVYNGTGINTDTTLTQVGMAADAKAVGDLFTRPVEEAVSDWLDAHPEATTTVQDGSLTEAKFSDSLKLKAIKDYVTPEMFGAKGDGVTDDTTAIQRAVNSGKDVFLSQGTYLIGGTVVIQNDVVLFGCGFNSVLKITGKITTDNAKHNINLHDFTVFASKSNGNAVEIIATNNALADNTLNITGVYFEFDNTVTNSTATMLYLYGVRESMISNCVFFGSDYHYPSGSIGLKAEADSTHLTMNINISGCAFSYLGDAIYLNGSEGNRIYLAGFRIINNTIIGCGYGVRTYYFDTPMISNNMIDYCEYPIYCESSTGITIDNNYIQTAHSGGCLYIINTSSAACDIINIFDNIIHSSNGSTAGSEITDGIVLEGGTSPVILRHVNIKGNFIFRVKTAINLAGTQFANISNNQVFYATTFVDGNNSSDYTKLFDNYVQSDVSYFCANKKDTWKITDNQWGSRHTNGTLRGTFGYSVAANSSAEYNVSFNGLDCVFYDVPAVNVYFKDVGTSWQDMFIAITSVSTSGFTVKIVNASGTVHSNVVGWSAILA